MILFQLVCPENHPFESWFRDSAAFDDLQGKKQLVCPHCGSTAVSKALMAPAVQATPKTEDLSQPRRPSARDIAMLKRLIEKNSEYVGLKFVTQARQMHAGDIPERPIYGEAKPADALKLLEDGVPVIPLPFAPHRKMN